MPTAYISPFTNDTNDYINRVKSVVQGAGYDVVPLSFRTLLSRGLLGLFKSENVVLVHWLESRVFSEGRGGAKIRPAGLLQFVVYSLVLALMRARFVYFLHDHAVHDLAGWRRNFSMRLIGLLRWLADVVVVHDPSFCDKYGAVYLPHPLYQEREPKTMPPRSPNVLFRAGILGAVRPYKRIEHIIDVWPEGPELLIRGRSDPVYEQLLRERIAQRGQGVRIHLNIGFMSREDFEAEIKRLDALILPHADSSALVSGAFFEAIGAVPVVIARSSPFVEWSKKHFESVLSFSEDSELVKMVDLARDHQDSHHASLQLSAIRANDMFGEAACRQEYGAILQGR
jgi:beta-1,4-mannosyltransferase